MPALFLTMDKHHDYLPYQFVHQVPAPDENLQKGVIHVTYRTRLTLLVLLDSIIVSTAIFIASWVVYPQTSLLELEAIIISAIALLFFHHLFASIYKLYNKVWAYASVEIGRAHV